MLSDEWTRVICDHAVCEPGRYKISAGMPSSQGPAELKTAAYSPAGASKDRATEVTSPRKRTGKSADFGARSIKSPEVKLSFHTDESSDLPGSRLRHKKLQHPATRKQLEEHMKSRTAAHRWGIPKRVQRSSKHASSSRTSFTISISPAPCTGRLCHWDEIPQAGTEHLQSKAEGFRSRDTTLVSPRRVSLQESGTKQHLLRVAEYPAMLSSEEMHQGKNLRCERETPEKRSHLAMQRPCPPHVLGSQMKSPPHPRQRIQHEWGLPSILQKSLRAFAPPPPDSRVSMKPRAGVYMAAKNLGVEGTAADHTPLSVEEASAPFPDLTFLDRDVKSHLEAHVRSRTAAHRWGLPKLVQDSLGAFHPPELCSQTHKGQPHPQREIHSEGEKSPELCRVKQRAPEKQNICQWKQAAGKHPSSPEKKPPFFTVEALGLLEFHIQSKKVQHMWGLPSAVLKSTRAFAPFPFEKEKNMQHTAKVPTKTCSWARGEVEVITPSLLFLSPEAMLHLDVHLRNMVAKHQWGLPARVQQSLKGFLPPRPSSRPWSAPPLKSFQVAAVGEGRHDDSTPRGRKTTNQKNIHPSEQVATPSRKVEVASFPPPVGRLPFLTGSAQELLEFHIQSKKVQHMWGLPSAVLKSLGVFAPFLREPEKDAQGAGGTPTKRRPRDTEVCISVESLVFLGPDITEGLEAHVRSRTAEHRWGLPKLVQKSLTAFLPLASLPGFGETRQPLLHPDSESPLVPVTPCQIAPERSVRRLPSRREASKELEKEKPTATSSATSAMPSTTSPTAELPFLTNSKQEALEFHIQHKKVQHEWGLPVTVQKSVHAFAPIPQEPHQGGSSTAGGNSAVAGVKDTVAEMGVRTKKPRIPGIVNVAVPSLHFLDADTKENLETHLRNLTIEHRWGVARLVHQTMRAFIPLPSHLDITEMEDLEPPSAYSRDKTLTLSDAQSPTDVAKGTSSEVRHIFCSELLRETEQGGASSLASQQPVFCPGTKQEHAVAIPGETGSWKVGRESPQKSTLQTRPHLKKAAQRQRSRVFDARQDPRTPFHSPSSPEAKKYRSNVSSRSTNLPRARCSSGRISSGRALVPRSSKTALRDRKGRSQQMERGFQRTADSSYSQAGIEQPQAPDISQKQGSRLGWHREKKNPLLHLPPHQPSVRALGKPSYGDLCEARRNLKPPLLPKGSENRPSEAGPRSPDSGGFKQRHLPVPRNQGPLERKRDSQGRPGYDLKAKADSGVAERKSEQGALLFSKEPRPLSTGEVSQFSTEGEWERVGDWDTDEEAGGGRDSLGKQQRGSPKVAEEMPKTETSLKAQPSLKGARSPPVKQSQPSPSSAVCNEKKTDLVKIERQSVLGPGGDGRKTVGGRTSVVVTVRVTGPEGGKNQRAKEEERKMLHRRKEGSTKGLHPGKETFTRHGRSHPLGTPRDTGRLKRESPKKPQEVTKGVREHGNYAQFIHAKFIQDLYAKEVPVKLSLLGTIVERKLGLRQGLHIWLQSQRGDRGSQKGAKKTAETSQPPNPQVARTAQAKRLEAQSRGSRGVVAPSGSHGMLHARPQQSQTSPNSEVRREKQPDSAKMERQRALGSGGGRRRMVGREASVVETAGITGPEGGKNQRAKKEEEKMLHRKKEGTKKGPHPGKETLVRHGRSHPLGTSRDTGQIKREALKKPQKVSEGVREHGNHAQFIQDLYAKEVPGKLSLLGTIVERKLGLRQGLRIWLQSQKGERGAPQGSKVEHRNVKSKQGPSTKHRRLQMV
uniref:Uncharacterized protein n=1 Tax=Sphaerodactylus townsendi TaxID=933632 RepID=A0ACB8G7D8_9SAUR